jgi:hypothetical protein
MKPLEYHPQTRVESKEAVDWYRSRSRTAALEFRDELKSALARLRKNPKSGRHTCMARAVWFWIDFHSPLSTESACTIFRLLQSPTLSVAPDIRLGA